MRHWIILAALYGFVLWCGCGPISLRVPNVAPQQVGLVSQNASDWYLFYGSAAGSPLITDGPQGTLTPIAGAIGYVDIPNEPGHVNYIQTPYFAPTQLPSEIDSTIQIEAEDATYWQADPNDTDPATFHIFFEVQNDNLQSPNGRFWYSYKPELPTNGVQTFVIKAPFDPAQWGNVDGSAFTAAEFQVSLQSIGWVGLTFGGQDFDGHGVGMAAGKARVTVVDFQVR